MIKEELINEIRTAFGAEAYPGDSRLVFDNSGYDLECVQIRDAFKGKLWQNLHPNFLFDERSSIYFFSKEGFKYYLPAFMIVVIEKLFEMDTLPDTLINQLTLPAEVDTVLLAEAIKRTRLDKQFTEIDFHQILQNQLQQNNKMIHNFIDYMAEFNEEQSVTILYFLEYMKQYTKDLMYNPQTAIDRYWFRFLQT